MPSKKLVEGLVEQMNFEFESANIYLAMAAYCQAENWDGFANFFLVQAEEERFHAMKIFHYLNNIGERAFITGCKSPNNEFQSITDCFESAYLHEKEVTKRIYALSDLALDERDHGTIHFLKWYIDEQIEEEAMFDNIIVQLKRINNDTNGMFLLDRELANRKFTPEG
ncbi:ferritin [Aeribacillus alveayuensis]|uniref:Ferritin n=1 Tax=Aeribacillus alveayuensis TaxID=279215 RepID=A0ABT9VP86_9BACI|nr:ferritin [Bacillus alveayuensis]